VILISTITMKKVLKNMNHHTAQELSRVKYE
jgi:hypothetical protein